MKRKTKTRSSVRRETEQKAERESRAALCDLATDLAEGLRKQATVADYIMEAAKPHDGTIEGAMPMLVLLGLALREHQFELRGLRDLARVLLERMGPTQ
jgi:hypothetical protein